MSHQDNNGDVGGREGEGELVRPLSRFEVARIVTLAKQRMVGRVTSFAEWIVLRKLQLYQVGIIVKIENESINTFHSFFLSFLKERRRAGIKESLSLDIGTSTTLNPLDVLSVSIPHPVLDALRAIQTTRYEHSFAARVYGHMPQKTPGLIAVDWESRPPWVLLMDDIHAHYTLAQSVDVFTHAYARITVLIPSLSSPESDQPERPRTPITYVSLQPSHLRQVHDLLARVFWDGVDGQHVLLLFCTVPVADPIPTLVSDALDYAPERCTVVATYGHLVVGAALLSSPQETYITYLAVRAGWENAQIAT